MRHLKDRLLRKIKPSPAANAFMQELALRSRNRFRSDRRFIKDLPDASALLVMIAQFSIWVALAGWALTAPWSAALRQEHFWNLFRSGVVSFATSIAFTLFSCVLLYHLTGIVVHAVSVAVLTVVFVSVLGSVVSAGINVSCVTGLLTFVFLALYYVRGLAYSELSCMFIKCAGRICWRNLSLLMAVYATYIPVVFGYALAWSASVWALQVAPLPTWIRFSVLTYCSLSFLVTGAFLRDFLQIWLSRVIYLKSFRHGGELATVVTSLARRPSVAPEPTDDPFDISSDDDLEEIRRQITRESMWWCVGTASRSAFHLVLRAFSVHLWLLALVQVFAPAFGPPANPTCVLDVFHVPTAIYGTSFTKSRNFVGETMLNHGMDKISVDVYIRTFIYYMFTYGNGIVILLALQWLLHFSFQLDFISASALSIFANADVRHFVVFFVGVAAILIVTSIDSVHMILCWAICETPTAVSHMEPLLMATLVSQYHARLDLKRFTGDRIEICSELTQPDCQDDIV